MFNGKDTGIYGYFCDTDAFSQTFTKDELFPLKKLKFEDIEINYPKELEKSLTELYGDYMKLPPEEKRKNHFPYCLDFGEEKSNAV